MITYTYPDDQDTEPIAPITPAMLAAMDADSPPPLDWKDALLQDIIRDLTPYLPGEEARLAVATRIALRVTAPMEDQMRLADQAYAIVRLQDSQLEALHRQRETLAQRLDELADGAAHVKGARR